MMSHHHILQAMAPLLSIFSSTNITNEEQQVCFNHGWKFILRVPKLDKVQIFCAAERLSVTIYHQVGQLIIHSGLFLHGCLSGNLAILEEHRIPSEGIKNSFPPWEVMLSATCGIKQKTPHLDSRGVGLNSTCSYFFQL